MYVAMDATVLTSMVSRFMTCARPLLAFWSSSEVRCCASIALTSVERRILAYSWCQPGIIRNVTHNRGHGHAHWVVQQVVLAHPEIRRERDAEHLADEHAPAHEVRIGRVVAIKVGHDLVDRRDLDVVDENVERLECER